MNLALARVICDDLGRGISHIGRVCDFSLMNKRKIFSNRDNECEESERVKELRE
jgi:hypothetical protein